MTEKANPALTVWSVRALLFAGVSAFAISATSPADAGGFAIREQSASSQGASFAGNAANTDLSAMYWNPAAAANKSGPGINSESHVAVIIPQATVTVETIGGGAVGGPNASSDIAGPALVPASYYSYQISERMFLGLSTNSGFGLVTKPENINYLGAALGRTSKLFTVNVAPTLAYKLSNTVTVGVGAQVQYADGKFAFASTFPPGAVTTSFKGDDIAIGGTAGIMYTPAPGTRIGLGYRSQMTHTLDGVFATFNGPAVVGAAAGSVKLKLPDIVTLSFNQAIAPNMRLLGTVEWSNWSRFQELRVSIPGPDPVIDARWSDGWFFSLGGEYDYSPHLTFRAGAAYEISPVDDPSKRIIGIPDSDRIWLSFGGSYKLSDVTTIDFAYTHIFLQDASFVRNPVGSATVFTGSVDASTDIVSFSYKSKFTGIPFLN